MFYLTSKSRLILFLTIASKKNCNLDEFQTLILDTELPILCYRNKQKTNVNLFSWRFVGGIRM